MDRLERIDGQYGRWTNRHVSMLYESVTQWSQEYFPQTLYHCVVLWWDKGIPRIVAKKSGIVYNSVSMTMSNNCLTGLWDKSLNLDTRPQVCARSIELGATFPCVNLVPGTMVCNVSYFPFLYFTTYVMLQLRSMLDCFGGHSRTWNQI